MATTVSTFADFLELAPQSGDLVLGADLDAQAEGFDVVNSFNIACNLDGQGHSISNVNLSGLSAVQSTSGKTIKDTYFRYWGVKTTGGVVYGVNSSSTFLRCRFSLLLSANNSNFDLATGGTFNRCAFDATVKNSADIANLYSATFWYCNAVIRGGNICLSRNGGFGTFNTSALVLDGCTVGGSGRTLSFGGSNAYLAFNNCKVNGGTVNGSSDSLFCGSGMTVSGLRQVSAGELQSREFLEEIGFLP